MWKKKQVKPKKRSLIFLSIFLFSCFSFLLESSLFYLWAEGSLSLFFFLFTHTIHVLFISYQMRPFQKNNFARFFPFLLLVLFFYGALVMLIAMATYQLRKPFARTFMDFYEEMFSVKSKEADEVNIFKRKITDFDTSKSIISFQDVMRFGTPIQKSLVIGRILSHYRPEFSSSLLLGLKDSNSVIRVRAATAVSRLEDNFIKKQKKLENTLLKNPQDNESKKELFELKKNISNSIFVDKERRKELAEELLSLLEEDITGIFYTSEEEKYLLMGEFALNCNEVQRAKEYFEKVTEKQKDITSFSLLKGYVSVLFTLKDYKKIRDFVKETTFSCLDTYSEDTLRWQELISLWRISSYEFEMEKLN